MDTSDLEQLLHKIIAITVQASSVIMDIYNDPNGFAVERKEDNTPVTRADQLSSNLIEKELNRVFPEALVVSEEGTQWSYDERKRYKYIFLVDPLDGTKEFVKRNGEFCINIALLEDGEPILGVIRTPAKEQVYYAYKGGGAWQLTPEGDKIELKSDAFSWKSDHLRFITSRSHMNEKTSTLIQGFKDPVLLQRGSAIKFAWLARGDADIYPKIGLTMEWDTAAGQVLLEEAGGQVVEFTTKEPLKYNKQKLYNPHFLAFGKTSSY